MQKDSESQMIVMARVGCTVIKMFLQDLSFLNRTQKLLSFYVWLLQFMQIWTDNLAIKKKNYDKINVFSSMHSIASDTMLKVKE